MNKQTKIQILSDFKEEQELKNRAEKRLKELKAKILADIEAGVYGEYCLTFDEREVKKYIVESRTDTIVRVNKI